MNNASKSQRYYTQDERLTPYAFACGYVECKNGAKLYAQHGVYFVRDLLTGYVVFHGRSIHAARRAIDNYKGANDE